MNLVQSIGSPSLFRIELIDIFGVYVSSPRNVDPGRGPPTMGMLAGQTYFFVRCLPTARGKGCDRVFTTYSKYYARLARLLDNIRGQAAIFQKVRYLLYTGEGGAVYC
jgi:hypothetical protein